MANGQMKEGGLWVLDTAALDKILKDDIDRRTLPEIIFIDEFTQVDTWTIQVLNYLGKKYGFKIN
jgi:hypothetical protein